MSPSSYIFTFPAGIIALSLWIVRKDDVVQRDSGHAQGAQITRSRFSAASPVGNARLPEPAARLDQDRYGWDNSPTAQGNTLGRNVVLRPLGERAPAAPDWLSVSPPKLSTLSNAGKKYPDISSYDESPPLTDPLATPVNAGAGYQITADEVTKLDTNAGKVVFNKNVRLISPRFHLDSQQLVVFLNKDGSTMRLMEAHGEVNVLLTGVPPEKAYRGQSGHATYNPLKDSIVLTDWPKVKGQSQEQVAASADTRMTLFTKSGRMTTDGRAQTRIAKAFVDVTTGTKK